MMVKIKRMTGCLIMAALAAGSLVQCSKKMFVTIGTGAVTGVYYPAGGAICRMINAKSEVYGIKATVESTVGSVYNVNAVLRGDLEFGVVQSDRQYQAVHGQAEWADRGPQTALRAVFALHAEAVTLVASVKSGIQSPSDLEGRHVNLGNPGSGPLQNSRDALAAAGLSEHDLKAEYVKAVEAPGLLQDERIDAFFYTVGHPSGNIKEATSGRIKVRLIPLKGDGFDRLIDRMPYYTRTVIPVHHYPKAGNESNVTTFGVKGTLVTSEMVDEQLVYTISQEIFENLEAFKRLHPAFHELSPVNMLEGLSAPLHRGALRYLTESGRIESVHETQ